MQTNSGPEETPIKIIKSKKKKKKTGLEPHLNPFPSVVFEFSTNRDYNTQLVASTVRIEGG